MTLRKYIHIFLSCSILFGLTVCCSSGNYRSDSGMVWNTVYNITYNSDKNLSDSILPIFNKISKSISLFDSASLVSKINISNKPIPVDSIFIIIYNQSVATNKITDGAFDPTLSPIIAAWGFGKGHTASPDTARVDSLLKFCDINKTHIANNMIFKDDPRTGFNFSAIAKGYGCDMIGEMFQRNNINDYLIEIGGEIATHGLSPAGGDWIISIDKPDSENLNHDSSLLIKIRNCGVATSGNYRNNHSIGNNSYGHIINPKNGRPAQTDILSATVVTKSCMTADSYATSAIVMGSNKAKNFFIRNHIAAFLILSDNSVWFSPEFKPLIHQQ